MIPTQTSVAEPEHQPTELLDLVATAGLLGCSQRHLYRLVERGDMPPPIKLGSLVRFRRSTIMKWLDDIAPAVG